MNKGKPGNVGIDSPKKPPKRHSTLYRNKYLQMRYLQRPAEPWMGDHGYRKQSL